MPYIRHTCEHDSSLPLFSQNFLYFFFKAGRNFKKKAEFMEVDISGETINYGGDKWVKKFRTKG